ncbi:hypothetical protein SSBR45G_27820 [Bradyrhizobium sp. SSBR45G]|nr:MULTISPECIES: hypothetical protein [unclassified Bradyrhizobium]GLH77874.1 hypothetical protein SSBR45G_27820 [Bradyrhizobium sp. SSBR45G]
MTAEAKLVILLIIAAIAGSHLARNSLDVVAGIAARFALATWLLRSAT